MSPDRATVVRLYGHLGKRFGRRFEFFVSSTGEAIRMLSCNFPSFKKYLIDNSEPGYHVLIGKNDIGVDKLHYPHGNETIKIIPAIVGGKQGGLLQIVLGVVLIAASVYTGGAAVGSLAAFGSSAAGAIGTAMVLGGISQLLFKPPKSQGPQEKEENRPSFVFNGPINTIAQGHPIPVLYGQAIVGSAVISASIQTVEFPA